MSYLKKGSFVTYVLKIFVSLFCYVFDFVVVEEDDFVVFAFLLHLEREAREFFVAMDERVGGGDDLQFVRLGVELTPQHILQFLEAEARHGRDEDDGQVCWQGGAKHVDEFLVEQVALRHSEYAMLREHLGIELLQLVEQDFILAADVIGVAGHHEEQQGVALDVTKEAQTEAASLAGTLDEAWNVGHDERLVVAIGHDAQ